MLRALSQLAATLPAGETRDEVMRALALGLRTRNAELVTKGAMTKDKAMEALLLVNRLFAETWLKGREPLGQGLVMTDGGGEVRRIVGVVREARQERDSRVACPLQPCSGMDTQTNKIVVVEPESRLVRAAGIAFFTLPAVLAFLMAPAIVLTLLNLSA